MRGQIKLTTRRELTAAIGQRYRTADRNGKKLILDEFVKVTGYHRKHAIRVLTAQGYTQRGRPVGHRIYQEAVKEALIVLWEASDRICGKRLKALLPLLVEAMKRHGHLHLQEGVKKQVLAISAATIDRLLRPVREKASGGRKKKSIQLNRVRKIVAVRTFADWEGVGPGYMEMDMVVHCGARLVGSFVHSLVLTDVASGWTECLALPVREQGLIVEAITGLRPKLPFPLLGLDTDNDSAFMNDTLLDYCQKQGIVLTRSRTYRKNDQAWVEQKNGAIVRKLIGYGRLEGLSETAALRRLYEVSRLYINFFQPSFKLKSKTREGARVHKKYELPETPCRRLLLRDDISPETKEALTRQMEPLDPVLLLKSIREAQEMLMALSKDRTPETAAPDASTFVKSLATAWRSGEVRPTHRQEAKPGQRWRTRPDPFAAVWPVLLGWLEERPDMEAKAMLKRLQASGFGEFPDGQLRTLQRRVRVWRKQIVQQLVYGAAPQTKEMTES
jgi:predicted RNA binding protein YcfA (HicA-like mRNA interferase family)